MRVYHRLLGDTPQRGFGMQFLTPGFPTEWMPGDAVRLSLVNVPYERKAGPGLVELHSAYELQTKGYGHLMLIRSASGSQDQTRPHAYSDMVVLDAEQTTLPSEIPVSQLLGFDQFIPLKDFWFAKGDSTVLPEYAWTPVDFTETFSPEIPQGMLEALLARSWRAMSRRAFGGKDATPVRVCLGAETQCETIIRQAKAFLKDVLLDALPKAVANIVSISAPVPQQVILSAFPGTALAVVYPEATLRCEFDLRTGAFEPLQGNEKLFIDALVRGERFALWDQMVDSCMAAQGQIKREHCALAADYDLALLLYTLEKELLNERGLLSAWQELVDCLSRRHRLSNAAALLAPLEQLILSRLGRAPQPLPLQTADLSFLWDKALTMDEEASLVIDRLLAVHQRDVGEPYFTVALVSNPPVTPQQEQRAARLLGNVLRSTYETAVPSESKRDLLADAQVAALCNSHTSLHLVMEDFIQWFIGRHPETGLFLLPLSTQYLDGYGLLRQTLLLVKRSYVKPLLDEKMCQSIRASLPYLNDENKALLEEYYTQCFVEYVGTLAPLAQVVRVISVDASQVLCRMLAAAEGFDAPLTPEQVDDMLRQLLPLASQRDVVTDAMQRYVDARLAAALASKQDISLWLECVDPKGQLIPSAFRNDRLLRFAAELYIVCVAVPPEETLDAMLRAAKRQGDAALANNESAVKRLYGVLGQRGVAQLKRWLPLFSTTADEPFVRQVHTEEITQTLAGRWGREKYWPPVADVRADMKRAGVSADDVLVGPASTAADTLLKRQFGALQSAAEVSAAMTRLKEMPDDAFARRWRQCLCDGFLHRYDALFCEEADRSAGVEQLKTLAKELGCASQAERTDGGLCTNALEQALHMANRLTTLDGSELRAATRRAIGQLVGCAGHNGYEQMRQLLAKICLQDHQQTLKGLSFARRTAVCLICCTGADGSSVDMSVLDRVLLGGLGQAARAPYAPQSLDKLARVAALFGTLEELGQNEPWQLAEYLQTDLNCAAYTTAVRKNRKMRETYFPWLGKGGMGTARPTDALVTWLRGH